MVRSGSGRGAAASDAHVAHAPPATEQPTILGVDAALEVVRKLGGPRDVSGRHSPERGNSQREHPRSGSVTAAVDTIGGHEPRGQRLDFHPHRVGDLGATEQLHGDLPQQQNHGQTWRVSPWGGYIGERDASDEA